MKRITALILSICLVLSFCACGDSGKDKPQPEQPVETPAGNQGTAPSGNQGNEPAGNQETKTEAFEVICSESDKYHKVTLNRLPSSVADLEGVRLDDEYVSAALIIAVLSYYETDPELCYDMLNYMMGPEDISAFDKNFIKEQFSQYPYVARSYMEGAVPSNDYKVDKIEYHITENAHSREEAGYVKLFLQSGGADSPRGVTLRHKESTDQWFLFSDSYKGLLAGIRQPDSNDKWK